MNANPIRVLVVDDSALARSMIVRSLANSRDIEVVGTAADPYIARQQILALNPDVITLDIEMPRMDGITFLKLVMKHRPMPVIIMSSLTAGGSEKALEALQAGAIDVLDKPSSHSASLDGSRLAGKIRAAAGARMMAAMDILTAAPQVLAGSEPRGTRIYAERQIILFGASTGGTEALKAVLTALPKDLPAICIVQHIPPLFSKAFAQRLNKLCRFAVREAATGDILAPGLALLAPGGSHMAVKWDGARYKVELNQGPLVHFQRPAVDILFDSAVRAGAAPHVTAALLTGMGTDGAQGLRKLRDGGATTIAQDEQTCVVFGMPKEAIRLGAAQTILPVHQIAPYIDGLFAAGSEGASSAQINRHAQAAQMIGN